LSVSDTATARNPPKMAYSDPITPITITVTTNAGKYSIPINPGTSNNNNTATEPEYSTLGIVTRP